MYFCAKIIIISDIVKFMLIFISLHRLLSGFGMEGECPRRAYSRAHLNMLTEKSGNSGADAKNIVIFAYNSSFLLTLHMA